MTRSVKSRTPPVTAEARARARQAVEDRVDCILDLMMRGRWSPGRDHRALASRFTVSVDTIEKDAGIAGGVMRRLLPLTPEQREEARALLLADLERHRRIALAHKRAVSVPEVGVELVDDPDVRAANQVLDVRAKVLGLYAPEKVEVTEEIAMLSDEETERRLVAAIEHLRAKRGAK